MPVCGEQQINKQAFPDHGRGLKMGNKNTRSSMYENDEYLAYLNTEVRFKSPLKCTYCQRDIKNGQKRSRPNITDVNHYNWELKIFELTDYLTDSLLEAEVTAIYVGQQTTQFLDSMNNLPNIVDAILKCRRSPQQNYEHLDKLFKKILIFAAFQMDMHELVLKTLLHYRQMIEHFIHLHTTFNDYAEHNECVELLYKYIEQVKAQYARANHSYNKLVSAMQEAQDMRRAYEYQADFQREIQSVYKQCELKSHTKFLIYPTLLQVSDFSHWQKCVYNIN